MDAIATRIVDNAVSYMFNSHSRILQGWCCVDDLRQEAYLKIFEYGFWDSDQYKLIFVVAKNACIGYMRKHVKGHRQRNHLFSTTNIEDLKPAFSVDEKIDSFECKYSFEKFKKFLTKKELHTISEIIDGKTQVQIAKESGRTEQAISWRIKKIKNKVKKDCEKNE